MGLVLRKLLLLTVRIASMKVSKTCSGLVSSLKDFELRYTSNSVFQWGQLGLLNIQEGGLWERRVGSAFRVVDMGRWSLPV